MAAAGKEINTAVVQPGLAKGSEYVNGEGGEEWKKYLAGASSSVQQVAEIARQRAEEGWGQMNEVAKTRGGVDLNAQFGKLGISGGGGEGAGGRGGYGQLERAEDGDLTPYGGDGGDDDFFEAWDKPNTANGPATPATAYGAGPSASGGVGVTGKKQVEAKTGGGWDDDEWKDF